MLGQEVSFLRQLQIEMQGAIVVPKPVWVFLDGQPAINLMYHAVYHPRTKQIQAKNHFVGDILNEHELTVEKCYAAQMGADMLKKHASGGVIRYNNIFLGMFCFPNIEF